MWLHLGLGQGQRCCAVQSTTRKFSKLFATNFDRGVRAMRRIDDRRKSNARPTVLPKAGRYWEGRCYGLVGMISGANTNGGGSGKVGGGPSAGGASSGISFASLPSPKSFPSLPS